MKYLVMQHYTGKMSKLAKLSKLNMQNYADMCNADYHLIEGNKFNPSYVGTKMPMQKMHMLNEEFDEYDIICMVDPDKFVVKNMTRNIFTQETGIGMCAEHVQKNAFSRMLRNFPKYSSKNNAFWGGAIYRLTREMRQKLRKHIDWTVFDDISNTPLVDEGSMHYLSVKANIKQKETTLPQQWCWCSYRENPQLAYMIHIRSKMRIGNSVVRGGDKYQSYLNLKDRGIIE